MQNTIIDLESKLERIENDNKALRTENAALKNDDLDPNDVETFQYSQFTMEEFVDRAMQISTYLSTLIQDLKDTTEDLGDSSQHRDRSASENIMEQKMVEHQKFKEILLRTGIQYNSKQNVTNMVDNYKIMCRSNDNRRRTVLGTLHSLSKKVENKSKQVTYKITKTSEEVRLFSEEITKNFNGLDKKCVQEQTQKEINLFLQILKNINEEIELFQRLMAAAESKDGESKSVKKHLDYSRSLCDEKWDAAFRFVLQEYGKQYGSSSDDEF